MLDRLPTLDHAEPPVSLLDRRVSLATISWEAIGWLAAVLVAAVVRLVERTTWPLSVGEAEIASDALALVTGGTLSAAAWMHPLLVQLDALGLFLFGVSDGIVRLLPAVAGLASLLLLLPLRHWIGRGSALAAAFVLALSPTLAFTSRVVDGGGLLVAGSLLVIVLLLRHLSQPSIGSAVGAGVAAGLLLLSGPLGWIALPLAVGAAIAMTRMPSSASRDWSGVALGFLLTLIVLSTFFFTHPDGFADFLRISLSALWDDHLATAGASWWMTPLVLIVDELLALALALFAVWIVVMAPERLPFGALRPVRALLGWTVVAIAVTTLVGGHGAPLYALAVLPLVLLAGVGLGSLVERIIWDEVWRGWGIALLVAIFLTFAALLSLFNTLAARPSDRLAWMATVAILVLLVVTPLVLATVWIARRLLQPALSFVGLAAVLLLTGLTLHTSLLLGATNIDRPGEPLQIGRTTPDVTVWTTRIEKLSADLTTFDRDVRDLTGGHGFTILVDEEIAQPFTWYLREFPNLRVVSTEMPPAGDVAPEVVIARPGRVGSLVNQSQQYDIRPYALAIPAPGSLAAPDWGGLLRAIVDVNQVRQFNQYLVDREVTVPGQTPMFELALRNDLAERVYGATSGAAP